LAHIYKHTFSWHIYTNTPSVGTYIQTHLQLAHIYKHTFSLHIYTNTPSIGTYINTPSVGTYIKPHLQLAHIYKHTFSWHIYTNTPSVGTYVHPLLLTFCYYFRLLHLSSSSPLNYQSKHHTCCFTVSSLTVDHR